MRPSSLIIIPFLLCSTLLAHVEHIPDVSSDPKAVIVQGGETLIVDDLLCVTTLLVEPGGLLGLLPGADIVFLDQPIDTDTDVQQITHGLIVLGDVAATGTPKTSKARANDGIPAGATSAQFLTDPEGWQVGDVLVIPDTRCRPARSKYTSHTEEVVITSVDCDGLQFTPTQYDHPIGTESWMTPHVANLTRDIVIRSENPDGTRGHVMVMGHGTTDWNHVEFRDLGRTDGTRKVVNSADGQPGSNENGRYPWHLHLLGDMGMNHQATGCVVNGSSKWAFVVHGTNKATLTDCVGYGAVGATFITEDGSERDNMFMDCIAIGARNGHTPFTEGTLDIARDGSGFWHRNVGNNVINCIAADVQLRGFSFVGFTMPSEIKNDRPEFAGVFTGNEIYSTSMAYHFRAHQGGHSSSDQGKYLQTVITDSTAWSIADLGVDQWRTVKVTFDGCEFHSDPAIAAMNLASRQWVDVFKNSFTQPDGFSQGWRNFGYNTAGNEFLDCAFRGFNVGLHLPHRSWPSLAGVNFIGTTVENTTIQAHVAVIAPSFRTSNKHYLDVTMLPMPIPPAKPEPGYIWFYNHPTSPVTVPYDVQINNEHYWFLEHEAEGRETREGVHGLVSQE
jgi:hypothetical protein